MKHIDSKFVCSMIIGGVKFDKNNKSLYAYNGVKLRKVILLLYRLCLCLMTIVFLSFSECVDILYVHNTLYLRPMPYQTQICFHKQLVRTKLTKTIHDDIQPTHHTKMYELAYKWWRQGDIILMSIEGQLQSIERQIDRWIYIFQHPQRGQ